MEAAVLFDNKFNSITTVIEFNPEWSNGTKYFDAAVEMKCNGEPEIAVSLKPGEMAKCTSQDGHKMIFVGTDLGTCVVFQRYRSTSHVLITNQARFLASSGFIENDILTYDGLKRIVGGKSSNEPNIGVTIANIRRCFESAKAIYG
jgi:hypothetical protein